MAEQPVVCRFAPSPTGYLHIGGARTALFNYLFAKSKGGKFLLRIEDTDRQRSDEKAVGAIFEGLRWLGLEWDGEPVFQFARMDRHAEVAKELLAAGKAYRCYASPEELDAMRKQQEAEGKPPRYDGRWRDRDPAEAPAGVDPVIRLKMPLEGETVIHDEVQGDVTVAHSEMDDMVLLRADGTPTYMLSVVVDDHDMGVTHIIRGADHLTNAFRQYQLYVAAGWVPPSFAHIPLIHGADGKKLSKRHGATGAEQYRDMGYLPAAMRNYLLRLGWAHGDTEKISTEDAIKIFSMAGAGRSPSRFDFDKLDNLNQQYLKEVADRELAEMTVRFTEMQLGAVPPRCAEQLERAMPDLKPRAKKLTDVAKAGMFLFAKRPLALDAGAAKCLNEEGKASLAEIIPVIQGVGDWAAEPLEAAVRAHVDAKGGKLAKLAQPLRAAATGSSASPSLFAVLEWLGREETLGRLSDAAEGKNPLPAAGAAATGEAKGKKSGDLEAARKAKADAKAAQKGGAAAAQDPVSRLDIRVGQIVDIKPHAESDKLYVEQVNIGEAEPRTVVSGLVEFVPIEQMQNRRVVVVTNLAARNMAGVKSAGLVLVATGTDGTTKVPVFPPEGAAVGDRLTCAAFPGEPDKGPINGKKKVWDAVFPELKTNEAAEMTYKGQPVTGTAGPCLAPGVAGGTVQ